MELNDFLLSPVNEVKNLAERAIQLKLELENRQITVGEYLELSDDLINLRHINEQSVSIETMQELWNLVDLLKNIKFLTTLL